MSTLLKGNNLNETLLERLLEHIDKRQTELSKWIDGLSKDDPLTEIKTTAAGGGVAELRILLEFLKEQAKQ